MAKYTLEQMLEQIAIRSEKQIISGCKDVSVVKARIDARMLCGDYITFEVSTIGFDANASGEDIINSTAGKQALYRELCAMYGVQ